MPISPEYAEIAVSVHYFIRGLFYRVAAPQWSGAEGSTMCSLTGDY